LAPRAFFLAIDNSFHIEAIFSNRQRRPLTTREPVGF
jgi:hypothetical protein